MKLNLLKQTLLLVISLVVIIACSDEDKIKIEDQEKITITVKGEDGISSISKHYGTLKMIATVLPTTTENKEVTWSITSGNSFAKIDAITGIITAIANGEIEVTATNSTGQKGTKKITIKIVAEPVPDPNSIVSIPDSFFKEYLINIANADTNKDGKIQYSEAVNYKGQYGMKIMTINSTVSDATGIEAFTGIEVLRCLNNKNIKSLDLSKNTELYRVTTSISSLTKLIGIEQLTKLKELQLDNSKIKSLDLSWNSKLEKLKFSCKKEWDTSGTTPKLISTSKLTYLNLANGNTNKFTSVILDKHPNLTCVKVDKDFIKPVSGWGLIDSQIILKNDGGDCK